MNYNPNDIEQTIIPAHGNSLKISESLLTQTKVQEKNTYLNTIPDDSRNSTEDNQKGSIPFNSFKRSNLRNKTRISYNKQDLKRNLFSNVVNYLLDQPTSDEPNITGALNGSEGQQWQRAITKKLQSLE